LPMGVRQPARMTASSIFAPSTHVRRQRLSSAKLPRKLPACKWGIRRRLDDDLVSPRATHTSHFYAICLAPRKLRDGRRGKRGVLREAATLMKLGDIEITTVSG